MNNEIVTIGIRGPLQDTAMKAGNLLLQDRNMVIVKDEKSINDFLVKILDRQLADNGIRVWPLNTFHNLAFDYYLCQLVIDCSNFHTLREGYKDRGIYLEFCGVGSVNNSEGSLSVIPKHHLAACALKKNILSFLGLSRYVKTDNHLLDSRYEIESSSDEFARLILTKELIETLSKSKELVVSIRESQVYCSARTNPKPNDMILLRTILEQICIISSAVS